MDLRAWLILVVMMSASLSGCFGEDGDKSGTNSNYQIYPDPWDRSELQYLDTDVFSRVSVNGTHNISTPISVFVPVPSITTADGGAGITGGAEVHLGLWLPEIDGCDFTLANVSSECKVPVIADVGPYYDDGDVSATTPADRLGRFLIENYVPHGFGAVSYTHLRAHET